MTRPKMTMGTDTKGFFRGRVPDHDWLRGAVGFVEANRLLCGLVKEEMPRTRSTTRDSPDDTPPARAAGLRRWGALGTENSVTGADSIHSGPIRSFTKKGPAPKGWGP